MIRNDKTIFGEPNSPNTVVAAGTLTAEQLIVGAGNKGVKTLTPDANSLIYFKNGVIKQLQYNQANKVVGTDENGDLVLMNKPGVEYFCWGGTQNPCTNAFSSNAAAGNNMQPTSGTVVNNDNGSSQVTITGTASGSYSASCVEFSFTKFLVLDTPRKARIFASASAGSVGLSEIELVDSNNNQNKISIVDKGQVIGNGQSQGVMGFIDVTIPAGAYGALRVYSTYRSDTAYSDTALVVSAMAIMEG